VVLKVLGIIFAVWLAFMVLGLVVHLVKLVVGLLIPLAVVGVIGYLVYKAVKGRQRSDLTRL
jgi:purine-cytosine permease-like protein